MLRATTSTALFALALSGGVRAQLSSGIGSGSATASATGSVTGSATGSGTGSLATVSIFPVGFEEDGLQGKIIGTGSDGTTYVLSGTFDPSTDAIPYTMTLVEGATHVSLDADILIDSQTLGVNVQCSIPADAGVLGEGAMGECTQVIDAAGSPSTTLITGGVELTPVPVAAGSFSIDSGSVTATHSVSTLGGSTSVGFSSLGGSSGVLGPTIGLGSTVIQGSGSTASLRSGGSQTPAAGSTGGAGSLVVTAAGLVLGTVASVLAGAFVLYL